LSRSTLVLVLVACGTQAIPTTTTTPEAGTTIEFLTAGEVTIENPDWMVVAEDIIWTLSDPELEDELSVFALKGINAVTSEIAFTVDRTKSGCDGLGVADGSLWVCDDDQILRLDPGSGEVLGTIPFAMSWDQGPLPADERGLWLLSRTGTDLVHVAFAGDELGRVPLPGTCNQVTLLDSSAFVACSELGSVVVVDTDGYAVLAEVAVLDVNLLAAGGDRVWLGFPHESGGVGWLTPDGQIGKVENSPDISLGCLLVDGASVWLRGSDIPLVRVEAASATVIETYDSERNIAGGCVARADGSIWIGSVPFSRIWRLDLND
jgi:hypothetical protein